MSTPFTFLLPLRYDRVGRVLLLQSGPAEQMTGIVERLTKLFPDCSIDAVMREADALGQDSLGVARVEVARWEDRFELLGSTCQRGQCGTAVLLGTRSLFGDSGIETALERRPLDSGVLVFGAILREGTQWLQPRHRRRTRDGFCRRRRQ